MRRQSFRHARVASRLMYSKEYWLKMTDAEIETLSPLRLPPVNKPLAIAYGTAELPALVWDSRNLHARRAAAHAPGALVPVADANHFTILDSLRRWDGILLNAAKDLARGQ